MLSSLHVILTLADVLSCCFYYNQKSDPLGLSPSATSLKLVLTEQRGEFVHGSTTPRLSATAMPSEIFRGGFKKSNNVSVLQAECFPWTHRGISMLSQNSGVRTRELPMLPLLFHMCRRRLISAPGGRRRLSIWCYIRELFYKLPLVRRFLNGALGETLSRNAHVHSVAGCGSGFDMLQVV